MSQVKQTKIRLTNKPDIVVDYLSVLAVETSGDSHAENFSGILGESINMYWYTLEGFKFLAVVSVHKPFQKRPVTHAKLFSDSDLSSFQGIQKITDFLGFSDIAKEFYEQIQINTEASIDIL